MTRSPPSNAACRARAGPERRCRELASSLGRCVPSRSAAASARAGDRHPRVIERALPGTVLAGMLAVRQDISRPMELDVDLAHDCIERCLAHLRQPDQHGFLVYARTLEMAAEMDIAGTAPAGPWGGLCVRGRLFVVGARLPITRGARRRNTQCAVAQCRGQTQAAGPIASGRLRLAWQTSAPRASGQSCMSAADHERRRSNPVGTACRTVFAACIVKPRLLGREKAPCRRRATGVPVGRRRQGVVVSRQCRTSPCPACC